MLTVLFSWLSRHRRWTAVLATAYFAVTVFCHGPVSRFVYRLQRSLAADETVSIRRFNSAFTICCVVGTGALFGLLWLRFRRVGWRGLPTRHALLSLALMAAAYQTLFVVNNEAVHFGQYAALAPFLLALTGSHREAMIWATLLGFLDEGYQYFFLDSLYLDFNDVIFDLLGAGLGLTVAEGLLGRTSEGSRDSQRKRPLWRSPGLRTAGAILAACLLLYAVGILGLWSPDDAPHAPIVLSRRPKPTNTWEHTDWGKTYHIVRPTEGFAVIVILVAVYGCLDRRTPGRKTQSN